jgi:hypothetical protein
MLRYQDPLLCAHLLRLQVCEDHSKCHGGILIHVRHTGVLEAGEHAAGLLGIVDDLALDLGVGHHLTHLLNHNLQDTPAHINMLRAVVMRSEAVMQCGCMLSKG